MACCRQHYRKLLLHRELSNQPSAQQPLEQPPASAEQQSAQDLASAQPSSAGPLPSNAVPLVAAQGLPQLSSAQLASFGTTPYLSRQEGTVAAVLRGPQSAGLAATEPVDDAQLRASARHGGLLQPEVKQEATLLGLRDQPISFSFREGDARAQLASFMPAHPLPLHGQSDQHVGGEAVHSSAQQQQQQQQQPLKHNGRVDSALAPSGTSQAQASVHAARSGSPGLEQTMPATAWLQNKLQHASAQATNKTSRLAAGSGAASPAQLVGSGHDRLGQHDTQTPQPARPVVIEID